jgi:16S rRNA (adenine1518-N6/adenine1519-N6)-dimethyltransferase
MAQHTLDQLRKYGLSPDTSYGQHFLVDDNILRVITRMADLNSADVVWEPGPGVGVLTSWLAPHVRHVHAVELDRRLEAPLAMLEHETPNITVHWGDALAIDPQSLEPAPTALVSNLPYNVAAPIIAETLQRCPTITSMCVMVQKEVGDRMFAPTGAKNYGALSVVVQTLAERTAVHNVSRAVFIPPPNVDSQLVALRRRPDPFGLPTRQWPAYAAFVRGAFVHRRKTLANNLQARGYARNLIHDAVHHLGSGHAVRPQQLTPQQFVQLYTALGDVETASDQHGSADA